MIHTPRKKGYKKSRSAGGGDQKDSKADARLLHLTRGQGPNVSGSCVRGGSVERGVIQSQRSGWGFNKYVHATHRRTCTRKNAFRTLEHTCTRAESQKVSECDSHVLRVAVAKIDVRRGAANYAVVARRQPSTHRVSLHLLCPLATACRLQNPANTKHYCTAVGLQKTNKKKIHRRFFVPVRCRQGECMHTTSFSLTSMYVHTAAVRCERYRTYLRPGQHLSNITTAVCMYKTHCKNIFEVKT